MVNEGINRRVLRLDPKHPAKKFLLAFIECREDCVGLHLGPDRPVDQSWHSADDGQSWTFSGFVYSFLSLDIALDEFHFSDHNASSPNDVWPLDLRRLRSLMGECAAAARQDRNSEILERIDQVLMMFDLWEEYLRSRETPHADRNR